MMDGDSPNASPSPESGSEGGMTSENHPAQLSYSLFSNPPNLKDMRQKFFDPVQPFELQVQEFETYYPFVDNVYTTLRSAPSVEKDNTRTDFFPCRIRQSLALRDVSPPPRVDSPGKQVRRKRQKVEETCPMVLKVTRVLKGENPTCLIERADPGAGHTHDLDHSDSFKRNSAIMDVARREGVKGFTAPSVFNQMQAESEKMLDAGGKFMKISDVRNVMIKWRSANPGVVLRTHDGAEMKPRKKYTRHSDVNHDEPLLLAPQSSQPIQPLQTSQGSQSSQVLQASQPSSVPTDKIRYPPHAQEFLQDYLPPLKAPENPLLFVTLTYASSLDARLSTSYGQRTTLSGPESKAMTHYLRSRYDGILIGVGTAKVDNPGLNCRLEGVGGYGGEGLSGQPQPVIIDPQASLRITSDMKVLELARAGKGKPPWIIVAKGSRINKEYRRIIESNNGAYVEVQKQALDHSDPKRPYISWTEIFRVLGRRGLKSVMVEGGGNVLSELLRPKYREMISSVIITFAPTFLGDRGTIVAPNTLEPEPPRQGSGKTVNYLPMPNRLRAAKWQPMGEEDVILCGKLGVGFPQPSFENLRNDGYSRSPDAMSE